MVTLPFNRSTSERAAVFTPSHWFILSVLVWLCHRLPKMLSCLNYLMLGLLLPQSTAPPVFLVLIIAAVMWREGACLHSVVWLIALYYSLAVCSNTASSIDGTGAGGNATLALTAPVPGRNLLNLASNGWFDPALVGYAQRQQRQSITSSSAVQSASASASRTASTERGAVSRASTHILPRSYMDFSVKGLGFVVDLGWRRTEEGLAWEQATWQASAVSPGGVEAEREAKGPLDGDSSNEENSSAAEQARQDGPGTWWRRASLLSSW